MTHSGDPRHEAHTAPSDHLVLLDGGPGDAEALQAAVSLGRRIGARTRALVMTQRTEPVTPFVGDGLAGLGLTTIQALKDAEAEARDRANAAAEGAGVPVIDGPEAIAVRLQDLCVVSAQALKQRTLADAFESVLMDDGVPALMVRGGLGLSGALVAWDGSREAARALRGVTPLLKACAKVTIAQAPQTLSGRDWKDAALDPVLAWLDARGVSANALTLDVASDVGRTLLQLAADEQIDLLVAGAYGQARLREAVFGGVTRTLLTAEDGPSLVLAH